MLQPNTALAEGSLFIGRGSAKGAIDRIKLNLSS
jgi:hypothetical protein